MICVNDWAVLTAGIALFFKCDMSDPKSVKEIIDTNYPELAKRLRDGKRNGK